MFEGRALVAYLTAGDPDRAATLNFLLEIERFVDVIELGIPFSDPVADGKTIERANYRALKSGFKLRDVFKIAREFREHSEKPLVLMTYFNPVYRVGVEKFVREAAKSGVDGMIVVDLPIEEAGRYVAVCRRNGMRTVFLAAPNTGEERLRKIDELSTGFVYLVSLFGTTGARELVSKEVFDLIKRAKRVCRNKLAVGFGISKPEHVREILKAGADGVVVGSALVEIVEKFGRDAGTYLAEKLKDLRRGFDA